MKHLSHVTIYDVKTHVLFTLLNISRIINYIIKLKFEKYFKIKYIKKLKSFEGKFLTWV